MKMADKGYWSNNTIYYQAKYSLMPKTALRDMEGHYLIKVSIIEKVKKYKYICNK